MLPSPPPSGLSGGEGRDYMKQIHRRALSALIALLLVLGGVGFGAHPAAASGYKVTPAPGPGCVNQTKWVTQTKTTTYESLYVATVGQCLGAYKVCGYGLSVWYTDTAGNRRNAYTENNGCTWSGYWWLSTPYFTAKRGTNVQVTFRWNWQWMNGLTFYVA